MDLRIEEEEDDRNLNYIAPVQKSLEEIRQLDKNDESLVKYKQTLLGRETRPADPAVANVQVTRLTLLCDEAPEPISMDLTGRRRSPFHRPSPLFLSIQRFSSSLTLVNREIVAGLRYHHVTSRKGMTVDKVSHMVGSYCPREEEHEFLCPVDEVPRGVMSRGHYKVMSHFTDDDKNAHLDWEWNFDLNKDWSE
uniref:Rho GDP dissociation inhibitor (GDI) gamma n=1 Tax=Cyclopterus lumpus TaxID=8103 RepID=A0A8C2XE01_CYCLU